MAAAITLRPYDHARDYDCVNEFLIETCPADHIPLNWIQPRWEYMHHHPNIDEVDLSKIGVFEENGRIVGVVNMEDRLVDAFFQIRPGYERIKPQMFAYAEEHFQGTSASTGRTIRALMIHEWDTELTALASENGYERWDDFREEYCRILLDHPIPPPTLPDGYRLHCLADGVDLRQVNRVLWRGFNHLGSPPDEELPGRRRVMSAPNFRHDLTLVAVDPDGNYASYCGMWVVPQNRVAYVEPVATDPDYRRRGLGRAVVMESIRRVAARHPRVEVVWVGSGLEFYRALGFEPVFNLFPWVKFLD